MGYAHVRTGVRLDSGGVLSFEDGSKDVLGEGREVAEVVMVSWLHHRMQHRMVQCSTIHQGTVQYSTVQYSTVQ